MILVTGGAGFIGSNFLHTLWQQGKRDIICLDALTYAGSKANLKGLLDQKGFHFIEGKIQDPVVVSEIFKKYKPTTVVHFAAESHVDRSIDQPDIFLETNILGTFNLLKCSLALKSSDKFRFVHISTDEVFGTLEMDDPPFTELTAYAPNSPYSASKASADHFVRAYHHTYGLNTVTINCSNNYGPRQYPEKLIPLMIKKALAQEKLPIYGTGENVRDWLYVQDFCQAIALIMEKGQVGETYNVGGDCELTNNQVAKTLCKTLDQIQPAKSGRSYAEQISYVTDRKGHDLRYSVSFEKLQKSLGWKPQVEFEQGLKQTIQWYLKEGVLK